MSSTSGLIARARFAAIAALCLAGTSPARAQVQPLRTEPLRSYVWHTSFVEITGVDGAGLIDHGRYDADRVERRVTIVNRSSDTIWFELRGCCGNDYYTMDRPWLAPNAVAHMIAGYEFAMRAVAWQKALRLEITSRSAPGEPKRQCEGLVFHSRGERVMAVQFRPNSMALIDTSFGSSVDTAVTIVATGPDPIDIRLDIEGSSQLAAARFDTAMLHIGAGDSLRVPISLMRAGNLDAAILTLVARHGERRYKLPIWLWRHREP